MRRTAIQLRAECGCFPRPLRAHDVLEVIGRLDALRTTRLMLLDDFLNGFLHMLFVDKWRRVGRTAHSLLRLCGLLDVTALLGLTLWLKEGSRRAPMSALSGVPCDCRRRRSR